MGVFAFRKLRTAARPTQRRIENVRYRRGQEIVRKNSQASFALA